MNKKSSLFLAFLVIVLTFIIVMLFQKVYPFHGNDLFFPICGAKALYQGADPYDGRCNILYQNRLYPTNPMTTIWAALPFAWMGDTFGPIILWSFVNGLLFYGIFRTKRFYLLWILLSPTYWMDLNWLQWSPLFMAIVLTPDLLPLSLVKPQSAIAVILTNLTKRRVVGIIIFGLVTLVFDPTWPLRWIQQITTYDGFIPLLLLPIGPFILLTLIHWQDKRAWFVFLMSLSPQRGFYDQLPLFTITENRRQALILVITSWIGVLLSSQIQSINYSNFVILFIYFPAIIIILISYFHKLKQTKPD